MWVEEEGVIGIRVKDVMKKRNHEPTVYSISLSIYSLGLMLWKKNHFCCEISFSFPLPFFPFFFSLTLNVLFFLMKHSCHSHLFFSSPLRAFIPFMYAFGNDIKIVINKTVLKKAS